MRASRVRFLAPGDKVRLLDEAFDVLPRLDRPQAEAAVGVLTVKEAYPVEIDGEPFYQDLTFCGPLEPYNVGSGEVELINQ